MANNIAIDYRANQDVVLNGEPDPDPGFERDTMLAKLDAYGMTLVPCRSEAIEGRQSSGIEQIWREDEEYYEGVDDANRGKSAAWREKPLGTTAGASGGLQPTGSTVFPNITLAYVDTASANTADILLPTDDSTWTFENTPVPEMVTIAEGKFPASLEQDLTRAIPDPQQREMKKKQLAQEVGAVVKAAREKAEAAQKYIQDWHVECQYATQVRAALESSSKIGTGVLKGPVPAIKRRIAFVEGQLKVQEDIKPITVNIDPWRFWPDPACGEDIHNGAYTWENDDITARKLEDLIGTPGYIREQIEKCLAEGPFEAVRIQDTGQMTGLAGLQERRSKTLFQIWYYHGMAKKSDLDNAFALTAEQTDDNGVDVEANDYQQNQESDTFSPSVYVQVTMVNNRVIRMIQNPLDTGDFPYDMLIWQKMKGVPYGISVARQVRTSQDIIKASWRNLMDNAGRAAGPQVIVNTAYVRPENGIYEFEPWKVWLMEKELDGNQTIDQVFRFIKVDIFVNEMMAIIEQGFRLAEYATGIPMITQGQTTSTTPETLGGIQIQNENASRVLRRIGKLYDAMIERHVRRYYAYLMQYGPDDLKGDFAINAKGGTARIELVIMGQQIGQMANMVANPIFGIDPKKWAAEWMKSMRIDKSRFEYDDEQWEEIVTKLAEKISQPSGSESAVEVAKIREQGANERKQAELQSKEATVERQLQSQQQLDASNKEFLALMEQYQQDVTAYQESMNTGRNDATLKTKLADTVLKLKAQMESQKQLLKAPTEPPGKAPAGQAFAK